MTYLFFIIALVLCGTTAFGLRLISKPHKNVLLENTLAPEHLDDPSVHSLITEFRKRILQIVGTFSVASLLFCSIYLTPSSLPYSGFIWPLCWGQLTWYKCITLEKCGN